jgi:4-amino-4-deoxy-L-arabinose transferase-like glycosyltransferase
VTILTWSAKQFSTVRNLREHNPWLFWILVVAVITRVVAYVGGQPWSDRVINEVILDGDALVYHTMSVGFLEGTPLSETNPAANRTMGYPYFLTAIYYFSNNSIWLVLAVQTVLNLAMIPMVYVVTRSVFDSKVAGNWAAGLFMASAIALAWATRYLFTETLFAFLFLGFLVAMIKAKDSDSIRIFFLAGVLLGLATIVRSVSQFLFVVPVLVVMFQHRAFSRKFVLSITLIAGVVVVISPFQLRNYNEYGHYSLSTISASVFYQSAVKAKARGDGVDFYTAAEQVYPSSNVEGNSNPFDLSRQRREAGTETIIEYPVDFIVLYVQGLISFAIGTEKSSYLYVLFNQDRPVVGTPHNAETFSQRISRNLCDVQSEYFVLPVVIIKLMLEYLLIIAGLFALVRRDQRATLAILTLSIAYIVIVTGFMGRAPRYRIPVLPIYAILGGGGAVLITGLIREWWKDRKFHAKSVLR